VEGRIRRGGHVSGVWQQRDGGGERARLRPFITSWGVGGGAGSFVWRSGGLIKGGGGGVSMSFFRGGGGGGMGTWRGEGGGGGRKKLARV